MLWFFEKHESKLRYEIRRETNGPLYELVITYPDGREEVETFADPSALTARAEHLHHALAAEGWESPATKARPRRGGLESGS